jgi:hypothetical protein
VLVLDEVADLDTRALFIAKKRPLASDSPNGSISPNNNANRILPGQ